MTRPDSVSLVVRELNLIRSVCFAGDGDGTTTQDGAVKGEANRLAVADTINAAQDALLAENEQQRDELERLRGAAAADDGEIARLRAALGFLTGDYGCTLLEPADPSEEPRGSTCRDRRPTQPHEWCYACIAHEALHGPSEPPYEEFEAALATPETPEGETDGE